MYEEDDLLPLSALQHLAYCPRQCALIHVERVWSENRFTAEGNLFHRRTDQPASETRGGLHVARAVRLHSFRLGLAGIADVVEFHRTGDESGVVLAGHDGFWRPIPVEYKRGRPKEGDCDQVQLAAQALCLEEMLGTSIAEGYLYYGKTRRRQCVPFDEALRTRTVALAAELRRLWDSGRTPPAEPGAKCEHCSLQSQCMPDIARHGDVQSYLERMLADK